MSQNWPLTLLTLLTLTLLTLTLLSLTLLTLTLTASSTGVARNRGPDEDQGDLPCL